MAMMEDPVNIISDINSKLRNLESKNNILAENLLNVNQNALEEYKRMNKEIQLMNNDIKSLKEELFSLKQVLKGFLNEVDFFAKKNDIKVLEKYINLWNPLEFVREEDVEKLIEEKLNKIKSKKGDKAGRRK